MLRKLNPDILIGILIASLFWVGVFVWQSSQPPEGTNPKSERCEGSNAECAKASVDERLANYTWWLAILTGGLVITAISQGYFLLRADRTARIAATAAKETVELTRAEQISNYRPRLRVRNIVVMAANPALVQRIGIIQPSKPVQGQLFVVNVGGSVANIIESHCIVFWGGRGLPMRRPYEGQNGNNSIAATRLEAGQSTPGQFISTELIDGDHLPQIGTKIIGGLQLWVMGWIEYADDRGIRRRTSFCREFEKRNGVGDGRFYAINDPDYEHEE